MMDVVKSYLNGNKQDLLLAIVGIETILSFCLVVTSFVVSGTANAGFNCVLTGLLNVAFVGGSYYVMKKSKAPIAIGFLIGVAVMMTVLNFMTAIYWGQLSKCSTTSSSISQYSCSNRTAYGAVCFFSVFLFLAQAAYTAGLILWRDQFIDNAAGYDEIGGVNSSNSSHNPYDVPSGSGQYPSTAPSADL